MGTKKGQVRKTARRAYEGKGPKRPQTKVTDTIMVAGDMRIKIETPNRKRKVTYISSQKGRGMFGLRLGSWDRVFKIRSLK
jgi:hypothetical protein